MSLDLTNQIPREIIIPPRTSTSASILSTQLQEFLPEDVAVYSPKGYNIITFNISSATSFLQFQQSYFRFNLKLTMQGIGKNMAEYERIVFDKGGIHSLFRNVYIETADGRQFFHQPDYNRLIALERCLSQDDDDVDFMSWNFGDAPQEHYLQDFSSYEMLQGSEFKIQFVNSPTDEKIELTNLEGAAFNNDFYRQLAPEDVIDVLVQTVTTITTIPLGSVVRFRVVHVYSNKVLLAVYGGGDHVELANPANAHSQTPEYASGTGSLTSKYIRVYRQMHARMPKWSYIRHDKAADYTSTDERTLCFQLDLPITKMTLPLWLIPGGIVIRLELENATRALRSEFLMNSTIAAKIDYQITNPRFFGKMMTLAPEIAREYENTWNSEEGLVYYLPSVRIIQTRTTDQSTQNMQINVGKRSVRNCFVTMMDSELATGTSNNTLHCPSLSTFNRGGLRRYQAQVGTHLFPLRAVEIGFYANEAFEQLKSNAQTERVNFKAEEWIPRFRNLFENRVFFDSTKFITSFMFTRDNGPDSALCGIDISTVSLELYLEYANTSITVFRRGPANGAAGVTLDTSPAGTAYSNPDSASTPMYIIFLPYDSFIRIRAGDGVTRID